MKADDKIYQADKYHSKKCLKSLMLKSIPQCGCIPYLPYDAKRSLLLSSIDMQRNRASNGNWLAKDLIKNYSKIFAAELTAAAFRGTGIFKWLHEMDKFLISFTRLV